jgi:hypothetical protein
MIQPEAIYLIVAFILMIIGFRYEEELHLDDAPAAAAILLALLWPLVFIVAAIIYIPKAIRFVARIGR